MDYKEKYLKGLERAKKTLDSLDENYRCHELTKDDIRIIYSRLFPELAESEDERIRKELIFFLKKEIPQCSIKEHADKLNEFVSYLEKQKEQKQNDNDDEVKTLKIKEGHWYACVNDVYLDGKRVYSKGDIVKANKFMATLDERSAAYSFRPVFFPYIQPEEFCKDILYPNTQNIIKSFVDSMSPDESLTGIEHDLALYAQLLAHYKAIKSDVQYNNALKGFAIAVKESLKEPKAVDVSANFEKAEKEKKDFVTSDFIRCIKKVKGFNEGEAYWLEYIGDDTYVGRSDNVLNSTFNITPKELFTHFKRLKDFGVKLSDFGVKCGVWKIIPLFKVGDFIKKKGGNYVPWKITEVNEEGGYYCGNYQHGYPTELMFRDQRDYERVDNPGMGVPKINGKPVSTENNVVKLTVDDGKQ